MFVFRRKNKDGKKVEQLLGLLQEDPENTKHRLKLADLYVRAGNKKTAIPEYQTAAKQLKGEGFNLKAISIYKKIFTLGGTSLNDYKSLASLYTQEGLLAEARITYEKILQIAPQDRQAQEALDSLERGGEIPLDQETKNTFQEDETEAIGNSEPVPIETLLTPSQDEETRSDPSRDLGGGTLEEMDMGVSSDDREITREDIPPGDQEDPGITLSNTQAEDVPQTAPSLDEGKLDPGDSLHGKLLRDLDVGDLSGESETAGEGISPKDGKTLEIDIENIQFDDVCGITPLLGEEKPDPGDSLNGKLLRDLAAEALGNASFPSEETDTPPQSPATLDGPQLSPPNTSAPLPDPSGEDPNLHYHLGVAYREMDLIDKAIEEFTNALEQRNNPLECLIMLARCYFEKGLFEKAAEFIHQGLKLENLTQNQLDLLHRQLEEVEALGKLA